MPVLVWIHGGALANGTGADFDGSALAADNRLVVVTINYRLAGLGFFAHPALSAENGGTSGNYGMLDQQAAMKWVKDNIAQFGGDPANVTIMGQSAGGVSVSTQLASPLAAGLFSKAVVNSGAYLRIQPTLAAAEQVGVADAQALACPGTDAAAAKCLRSLSFSAVRSGTKGAASGTWSPVVDQKLLKESTAVAFNTGRFNRVPTIMGTVKDEGTKLLAGTFQSAPLTAENYAATIAGRLNGADVSASEIAANYAVNQYASPTGAAVAAYGDYRFSCAMLADAASVAEYVPKTWTYEYAEQNPAQLTPDGHGSWPGPTLPFFGSWGDYHSADLAYWFNQFDATEKTASNLTLSREMRGYLANFARTGDPNGDGLPNWLSAGSNAGRTMLFATPLVPNTDSASRHHCALWQTKPASDRLF